MKRALITILALVYAINILNGQDLEAIKCLKNAKWEVTQVAKGITLKQFHFKDNNKLFNSNQYISIIEINTKKAKGRWALANNPGYITQTSKFAKDSGAIVAINGTFYNMSKPYNSVSFFRKFGELCYNFTENMGQRDNGAVAINSKGEISIIAADTDNNGMVKSKEWAKEINKPSVMGSGPMLLNNKNNSYLDNSSFNTARHPRSAIAITKNRVYLIAVDGRSKEYAQGVSLTELNTIIHYLGAEDALNLDGGGSTTLYIKQQGVVNHPSDNKVFDKNGERYVVNSLLFIPNR